LAAGLYGSHAVAQETAYPLTLENCSHEITFEAAPARVVAVGQSTTEMLYALGVGDRVVGTSVWFNDVLPEYAEVDAGAERLADNDPSFESVVSREPELVTAQFEVHVGPQGVVGRREQFHELGIPSYVMPADCEGKDNTVVADGVRTTEFSTDLVYRAVSELSEIFDVQERGTELSAELQDREAAAIEQARSLETEGLTGVFWFSSAADDIDPFVAGQNGIPAYIMRQLGITNVVETDEEWPVVGWETIARADPDVIMIARMDRRRYAMDDHELKLEFLQNDPVASQMTAVQEGRIVIVDAHAVHAGIRLISGLEAVSDGLASFNLAQ
jgi:iron complex transport system substrate-binding protein